MENAASCELSRTVRQIVISSCVLSRFALIGNNLLSHNRKILYARHDLFMIRRCRRRRIVFIYYYLIMA